MGRFANDPDYTLRWPSSVLDGELRRLIRRAETEGGGPEWQDEVRLLLRQAFSSTVPVEDFERVVDTYDAFGDEPF